MIDEARQQSSDVHTRSAMMFSGQGSQCAGMGKALYDQSGTFRTTLQRAASVFRRLRGESLLALMFDEDASCRLHQTELTQPALYALECGLANVLLEIGLKPSAVLGHSVGEFAAAYVSGVFDLEDGMTLVTHRGLLMQSRTERGGMASARASRPLLEHTLAANAPEIDIAAINGPNAVTIAGRPSDLSTALDRLEALQIPCQELNVSRAFHSRLMDPMLEEFRACASTIQYRTPTIPFVSSLTGRLLAPCDRLDADYWTSHARKPVLFAEAVAAAANFGIDAWVEVGPKPTLVNLARRCLRAKTSAYVPTLLGTPDEVVAFGQAIAALNGCGHDLDRAPFSRQSA